MPRPVCTSADSPVGAACFFLCGARQPQASITHRPRHSGPCSRQALPLEPDLAVGDGIRLPIQLLRSGVGKAMGWTRHDYEDIPGTYVFDGKHAHGAYALNKLLFSFCDEANRAEFDKDPAAYCDKYGVAGQYKEFVLKKDFLGMLKAGANI